MSTDLRPWEERLPRPGESHDHAHEHSESDLMVLIKGGRMHLAIHQARGPGYSHEHLHMRSPEYDHHAQPAGAPGRGWWGR